MRLVTGREMQAIDRRTIEGGLVPSLVLMENAGQAAARTAIALLGEPVAGKHVEILCGKGNNGGDGLVVARALASHGVRARVHLTHPPAALSPDARANHTRLAGLGVEVRVVPETLADPGPIEDPRARPRSGSAGVAASAGPDGEPATDLPRCLAAADLCIDALLGTGGGGALDGRLAALVNLLGRTSRRTLAVDVPSGVDADTGEVLGTAVWADVTATFGLPKLGLVLHPGRERTGRLVVCDIGFPAGVVQALAPDRHWAEDETVRALLPRLAPTTHKYERGSVLLLAGSRSFPGAGALAALGALRAGAGIVHLVVPESIRALLQTKLTEVIVHGAPETEEGTLAPSARTLCTSLLERAGAVAVGPGLGEAASTRGWVGEFLAQLVRPAVVDADALLAMPAPPHPGPRVVTPHAGELGRWTGRSTATTHERLAAAAGTAAEHQVVVLAKGAPTFVATPTGALWVNATGHAGLATAGSGDVLTGVVAGLLAQGLEAGAAAVLGAFLHGRAAEIATAGGSRRSLLAGDLLGALGPAYASLE